MAIKKDKRKRPDRRIGPRRAHWLVEDWRKCWKWVSVQVSALAATFAMLYEFVPAMKEYISPTLFNVMMGLACLGVIFGRLKNQHPVTKGKK